MTYDPRDSRTHRRGIYRTKRPDGVEDDVMVRDVMGGSEMPLGETVYRERGYFPNFDDLSWYPEYQRAELIRGGRFDVHITDSNGVSGLLGAVTGADLEEAELNMGKLVRRKNDEAQPDGLGPEGTVALMVGTEVVNEPTKVGEHLTP